MFKDPIFFSGQQPNQVRLWGELGFKFGDRGAHTSRTIMLEEISSLLRHCPESATRADYARALVDENCLGKHTLATRVLTLQRLSELYGVDPAIPLFRILRLFWDADQIALPQLALLMALARDPLLRATASVVLETKIGDEIARQKITDALREATHGRLNESTLDKVVRNTGSSWTQAGHLEGRTRKRRVKIQPTPASTAFAMLLGFCLGARGRTLFDTIFTRSLDRDADELLYLAMDARRLGFLDIKSGGGLTVITFDGILTSNEKKLLYGQT